MRPTQLLTEKSTSESVGGLQVVTLILSVYVLLALAIQTAIKVSPETNEIFERVDLVVCVVFLTDFFVRLYRAPSKGRFLKWGWIDFVSSIPMLNIFRVGRVVRVVRVFRILRAFRSTKNLVTFFLHHRKVTSFAAVATICFVLMVFSAIAILSLEDAPESNIKDPGDAFWWAFVTMTTVGYGDKYPVTGEGRIVACILMTAGAGLFATFTGFVASMFLQPEAKTTESEVQQLIREVQALSAKVEELSSSRVTRLNDT